MFSALLYLQYHSIANRFLVRFRRLKQPKYLFGGIVGAVYFYFYFFRYLFGLPGGRPGLPFGPTPAAAELYETLGASILLIVVVLAWVLPHSRAALAFSEAEVAFLFPAPLSRRGLIHYKLLRSQAAILFTVLFLMLVTNRFGGRFWIHAAGWWLILSTLNLHLLGSSFMRTILLDKGITNWRRRWLILGLVLAFGLAVIVWTRKSLPPFDFSQMTDLRSVQDYLGAVLNSGPLYWILLPFRFAVRPYLAPDGRAFASTLFPAVALLLLHYWWVAQADVAFEEASVVASKRIAERVAAVRSGNLQAANPNAKGRRAPFVLGSVGSPVTALLWKNLISAGQAFTPRLWIILAATMVMACVFLARGADSSNLISAIGMAAGMLVIWSLFIGPQVLRQDLRQDLPLADVLKMYPIHGWEVVLGEMLAPMAILSGVQWLLLLISGVLLWSSPMPQIGRPATVAVGFGAALVVPVLNLIILQIPNGAVLLFPAWLQVGKERAHGIELTGQRIIAIFAQLLVFILALIPAAIAFGSGFFVSEMLLGRLVGIVLASALAALVLAGEAALGIILLGKFFERFDISAEFPVA
jgi:hypothetical protein